MDLSGVIFVVLALVWAIYLIPKALKHHDELARTRSVEEVSDSARVVRSSPRFRRRTGSTVVEDARVPVHPTGTPTSRPVSRPAPAQVLAPGVPHGGATRMTTRRHAAAMAARRRRRILFGLLVACAVVAALALAGVLARWSPLIAVGLVVAFLVLSRVLVRREQAQWAARRRTTLVAADDSAREEAAVTPAVEAASSTVAAAEDTSAIRALTQEPPSAPASVPAQEVVRQEAVQESPGGSTLWDPLPVTLPTYVGKPRATRSVRTIDLGDPGVSDSGHAAGGSTAQRALGG